MLAYIQLDIESAEKWWNWSLFDFCVLAGVQSFRDERLVQVPGRHAIRPWPSNLLSIQLPQDRSCQIHLQPVDISLSCPTPHEYPAPRLTGPSHFSYPVHRYGDIVKTRQASVEASSTNCLKVRISKWTWCLHLVLTRRLTHWAKVTSLDLWCICPIRHICVLRI